MLRPNEVILAKSEELDRIVKSFLASGGVIQVIEKKKSR